MKTFSVIIKNGSFNKKTVINKSDQDYLNSIYSELNKMNTINKAYNEHIEKYSSIVIRTVDELLNSDQVHKYTKDYFRN